MKKLLVLGLVALFATSASAATVSLLGPDGTMDTLYLEVSDTVLLGLGFEFGVADTNDLNWYNFKFNLNPFGPEEENFEVTGYVDGVMPMYDRTAWPDLPASIEIIDSTGGYPPFEPGLAGPGAFILDYIEIHCTAPSTDYLYFFSESLGDINHPRFWNAAAAEWGYAVNMDLPNFVHYANAWYDPNAAFDVPFMIVQTPEPASLALLAFGGLALLRRRK